MTPEQVLDKKIMLWCGQHGALCFHLNVGKVKLSDGRYFSTGMPVGWPDLMILTNKGQAIFCETKIKPNRPTKEQLNTIDVLVKRGFLAFVCYSLEQFIETVEKAL